MKTSVFALLFISSLSALANDYTSTECTFKKNPKNKLYLDFYHYGGKIDTGKAMLILQAGGKGKDFTYYNYAFMTNAMRSGDYIPYGRRAEFVGVVNDLERSGKYSFQIVNYSATTASLSINSIPKSRKILGAGQISFDAVLTTVLKTDNITALENGSTPSVNEISCLQRQL